MTPKLKNWTRVDDQYDWHWVNEADGTHVIIMDDNEGGESPYNAYWYSPDWKEFDYLYRDESKWNVYDFVTDWLREHPKPSSGYQQP